MNVIGIDPSSRQIGVSVFIDNRFKAAYTYKTDKKLPLEQNLENYRRWLIYEVFLVHGPIELTVVETAHSSIRNVNTFKKIAYYESISMTAAASVGSKVELMGVSTVRKLAFGKGNLSKDEVGFKVMALEPGKAWESADEKDAYALCLAGLNKVK